MTTVTMSVPDNWPMYVAAIGTAIVASALVYVFQIMRKNRKGKKFSDAATHVLLVVTTLLFTGLEYAIPFIQEHLVSLQTLPHVGKYVVGIYAAMNFLYSIKLKAWFQVWFKWLSKKDASTENVNAPQDHPLVVQPVPNLPVARSDSNSDF